MTDQTLSTIGSEDGEAGPDRDRAHYLVVALQGARPAAPTHVAALSVGEPVIIRRGESRDPGEIGLSDGRASSPHAEIADDGGAWFVRDLGSKNGTFVNSERASRRRLRDGDVIEIGSSFLVFRTAAQVPENGGALPLALRTFEPSLQARFRELARIAASDRSVLIRGDTGTGKELTARAVHELSGRRGAFVGVNCGALTESLLEAELFGVRRGAYSGAAEERPGLVRSADGGTLFLDEIAELSESSQVALLRVLQESEVRPVGASAAVHVNVRFVAATHQDLERRIRDGRFRQDLYARLSGHVVALPPLCERREDIGMLVAHILGQAAAGDAGALALRRSAGRALMLYDWPLNIRELDNALRAALLLIDDDTISLEHLPEPIRRYRSAAGASRPRLLGGLSLKRPDELRRHLEELYCRHQGNVSAVARELGRARAQIQRWNRRLGIDPADFDQGE